MEGKMGNERVEGYAQGFKEGWDKGLKEFIKKLKKKHPCCMKKRKCLLRHELICSNCRLGFEIDSLVLNSVGGEE